ncbi:alpha/beta hydrolase family protein [Microbacterium insulae]|uniref:Alpha/beta hydrolase family protein n=1 Tax=Microbacterium insulae TaxID=483014 RepID=A0ABW3AML4_9MICO
MKLPYTEVEFDAKGGYVDPEQIDEAEKLLDDKRPTDVIVVAHGWNNTAGQARELYERLVDSIVAVRPRVPGAASRRLAVVGVLWPSIQWAPVENDGAGAGIGDELAALEAEIAERVDDAGTRERLLALAPRLDTSSEAQEEFVALLRTTLPQASEGEDGGGFEALTKAPAAEVMAAARGGGALEGAPAAAGGAASLDPAGLEPLPAGGGAGFFDSIVGAARNLVNVATYYTMKERAGTVGTKGIADLLDRLHAHSGDTRLHLVGHSFGGRAMTAATVATSAPVSSLSLLQAAYSHFGMAEGWDGARKNGLFVTAPGKVHGPIIITHTRNDKAVGIAYPIASRLARQIGVGLGDENDPYGGIGRNGALKTPGGAAGKLLDVGGTYAFAEHDVWSLDADAFITGHGDVTGRQVGYAVLSAVTST